MKKIPTLTFAQLKNAEHVAFFNNVAIELEKKTAESLGLTASQLTAYRDAVDAEQDIVNRSMASIYTAEMEAMDIERDRLYRLIRHKLQECELENPGSPKAKLNESVQKNLLNKYGNEIVGMPYQEETALLRGFILDVTNFFDEDQIQTLGITSDLIDLETANNSFSDQYNERATERSFSTTELTKKLRADTEEHYAHMALHLEFKANGDTTEVGVACGESLAVVSQIVKDARTRLNQRLGHTQEPETEE